MTDSALVKIPVKGRGAVSNPVVRYHATTSEAVDDGWHRDDDDLPPLRTTLIRDATRTIIARNDSPDIPFDRSINPYRGCEHGCVYCFARPTHAYLGLSPGLDFESKLLYKPDAAALLEAELRRKDYRCAPIAMGTNTDPYQPVEKQLGITRRILEVLAAYRHPVAIVTKSALIERDIDLLADMAGQNLVSVMLSVTTLDRDLARHMEPRAATPARRIKTLRLLNAAGIPAGAMFAPVIPALNDTEMEAVLEACAEAGARSAGYVLLRLPLEVKDLFREWLTAHVPLKAGHVMSLINASRGGRDNDPNFGSRMRGSGVFAEMIRHRFTLTSRRLGMNRHDDILNTGHFRPPVRAGDQLALL